MPTAGACRSGLAGRNKYGARKRDRVLVITNSERRMKTTTIETYLGDLGGLLIPGCYDAFSARLMARQGYKTAFVSGAAVSATLLGEPDVGLLTPPEMARKCNQIANSSPSMSIIADADTGGGSTLNVQRTIRQLIANGCKGCILEDQMWPKRSGHMREKTVVSMEEFASKVAAARAAIGEADFFLIARTDARGTSAKHGLAEAITRGNLSVEAGADAALVEGPRSTYELQTIAQNAAGYIAVSISEGGLTPAHTYQQLKEMGFHLVFYPMSGIFAVGKALQGIYRNLGEEGSTSNHLSELMSFDQFRTVVGYDEKVSLEEKYARGQKGHKLVVHVPGRSRASDSQPVTAAPGADNGSNPV